MALPRARLTASLLSMVALAAALLGTSPGLASTGAGLPVTPGDGPPAPSARVPVDFEGADGDVAELCMSCHKLQTPVEMQRYKESRHAEIGIDCVTCHGKTSHNSYVVLSSVYPLKTLGADGKTTIGSGESVAYSEWWPRMFVRAYQACQDCHSEQYLEWVGIDRRPANIENAHTPFHGQLRYDMGVSAWKDMLMASFGLLQRKRYGDALFGEACVLCHSQTMEWNRAGLEPEKLGPIRDALPQVMKAQDEAFGTKHDSLFLARCVECHSRHRFSAAEATRPEACAKCHMGPDHPQYEAFMTSKHGWVYKNDGAYPHGQGPSCTTCHMGQKASDGHTVHTSTPSLAWNYKKGTPEFGKARELMVEQCKPCHAPTRAARFLEQADISAKEVPARILSRAQELLDRLYRSGRLSPPSNPFLGEAAGFLPTFFHATPWGWGEEAPSPAERLFWDLWREYALLAQETGAFHFNPAYWNWKGLKPALQYLAELEELVREIEAVTESEKPRKSP